ncbi:hypothetical protein [Lichenibacterium dinghuense]|uniref:hypothetical protein n=1 Tax=Lichenibacterium dinghuense TaxID=2895977 RepID=UPI001F2296E7|nr:hypothetical protein [Lichenibacterium sp. 6Y81]
MTHFAALVITPHRPDEDEMGRVLWSWCYHNPDALDPWYDWFQIGGRFEGALDPDWTHEGCKPVRDSSQRRKRDLDSAALGRQAEDHKAAL